MLWWRAPFIRCGRQSRAHCLRGSSDVSGVGFSQSWWASASLVGLTDPFHGMLLWEYPVILSMFIIPCIFNNIVLFYLLGRTVKNKFLFYNDVLIELTTAVCTSRLTGVRHQSCERTEDEKSTAIRCWWKKWNVWAAVLPGVRAAEYWMDNALFLSWINEIWIFLYAAVEDVYKLTECLQRNTAREKYEGAVLS